MTAQEKIIAAAEAEVGYLEKKTREYLDEKTMNAGDKNYTKYARDLDDLGTVFNAKKQGYSWCAVFVTWLFVTCFGQEVGQAVLHQKEKGLGASCRYAAAYYKGAGAYKSEPHVGDQIFFGSGTTYQHTGIVVAVDDNYVTTIEGNTSDGNGVIPNGGAVCRKKYHIDSTYILGYGRPDWSLIPTDDAGAETRYHTVAECPSWAQPTVKKLIDAGALQGGDSGLDLSNDMLRVLVICDRMGAYDG